MMNMNTALPKEMHTFWEKETCNQSSPSKKPKPVSLNEFLVKYQTSIEYGTYRENNMKGRVELDKSV